MDSPIPESQLADVLLGELFPRQEVDDTYVDIVLEDLQIGEVDDDEDYALFEVAPRDPFATTEFVRVRDTSRDHVVTVRIPRGVLESEREDAPQVSSPYERIEIETILVPPSIPEPRGSRAPDRLARGTDKSSVVAQSAADRARDNSSVIVMPSAAPRGADPSAVRTRVARGTVVPRVPNVPPRAVASARNRIAHGTVAPRVPMPAGVPDRRARGTDKASVIVAPAPETVAPVPEAPPREVQPVSSPPPRAAVEASEPDVFEVWLEEDPGETGDAAREQAGARFMSYANALPFPLRSAPFERVELGELPAVAALRWPDDATDIVLPTTRTTTTRVIATILVLACALGLGVGLALLVLRSATV